MANDQNYINVQINGTERTFTALFAALDTGEDFGDGSGSAQSEVSVSL